MASNLQRNRRSTWLRLVLEGPVAALKRWRGMQATETSGWQMAGWCVSGASTPRHLGQQHPNDARRTAPGRCRVAPRCLAGNDRSGRRLHTV